MNSNDLRMISLAALHTRDQQHYDTTILEGTSKAELDPELLKQYLHNARRRNPRAARIHDDEQLLQMTNVTDGDGQLRMGGLYAMGYMPEATFPSLAATAAVRVIHNEFGVRTRNLKDFGGPIPLLVEETMEWVRENISEERAYSADGHMESRSEFPMSAVRELLANAFVHRDLGPTIDSGKRVEIRILHDRLIIKSPGGLKGLSAAQLESSDLTKAAVNQRVYEIAKHLETTDGRPIIEGEGGGIPEVYHAMRVAGKPDPLFFDNGVEFTVNLLRGNRYAEKELEWLRTFPSGMSWIKKETLIALYRGETWTQSYAAKEFARVSPGDVRREIEELIQAGLIAEVAGILKLNTYQSDLSELTPVDSPQMISEISGIGPNAEAVYLALVGGNHTVALIQQYTQLSNNQVRYALSQLIDVKAIAMVGGRGKRGTRYELVGR